MGIKNQVDTVEQIGLVENVDHPQKPSFSTIFRVLVTGGFFRDPGSIPVAMDYVRKESQQFFNTVVKPVFSVFAYSGLALCLVGTIWAGYGIHTNGEFPRPLVETTKQVLGQANLPQHVTRALYESHHYIEENGITPEVFSNLWENLQTPQQMQTPQQIQTPQVQDSSEVSPVAFSGVVDYSKISTNEIECTETTSSGSKTTTCTYTEQGQDHHTLTLMEPNWETKTANFVLPDVSTEGKPNRIYVGTSNDVSIPGNPNQGSLDPTVYYPFYDTFLILPPKGTPTVQQYREIQHEFSELVINNEVGKLLWPVDMAEDDLGTSFSQRYDEISLMNYRVDSNVSKQREERDTGTYSYERSEEAYSFLFVSRNPDTHELHFGLMNVDLIASGPTDLIAQLLTEVGADPEILAFVDPVVGPPYCFQPSPSYDRDKCLDSPQSQHHKGPYDYFSIETNSEE